MAIFLGILGLIVFQFFIWPFLPKGLKDFLDEPLISFGNSNEYEIEDFEEE